MPPAADPSHRFGREMKRWTGINWLWRPPRSSGWRGRSSWTGWRSWMSCAWRRWSGPRPLRPHRPLHRRHLSPIRWPAAPRPRPARPCSAPSPPHLPEQSSISFDISQTKRVEDSMGIRRIGSKPSLSAGSGEWLTSCTETEDESWSKSSMTPWSGWTGRKQRSRTLNTTWCMLRWGSHAFRTILTVPGISLITPKESGRINRWRSGQFWPRCVAPVSG